MRIPVRKLLSAAVVLGALCAVVPSSAAHAETRDDRAGNGTLKYVALGDSFTSGPFVRRPVGPLICGRSANNYPHLVSERYSLRAFVDVSCSGATMENMFEPQFTPVGILPPQLDAVTADTDIVTVGIGADSMGYGELALTCAGLDIFLPIGETCKRFHSTNGDEIQRRIDLTTAKMVGLLNAINHRAPNAEIFIIGYPAVLPEDGKGCWPFLPLSNGDLVWLRDSLKKLNQAIFTIASSQDVENQLGKQVTLVDLYNESVGHDVCKPIGTKWFEHILPTETAAPLHPNPLGMEFAAQRVLAAFG